MITYTYIVKCPHCEDEFFDFFDEAKEFALSCLSSKPIITQTEVNRNDFGECTDHCDLGTVWSWEDVMKDTCTDAEPAKCIFTKDDLKAYVSDEDPEFANIDNSVDYEIDEISEREPVVEDTRVNPIDSTGAIDRKLIDLVQTNLSGPITDRVGSSGFYSENGQRFMVIPVSSNSDSYDFESYKKELKQVFPNTDIYCMMDDSEIIIDVTSFYSERKPIPEGMTIEELVEAMEENEDTVECTKCGGLFEKATCTHNKEGFGWCCTTCEPADTLVEAPQEEYDLATLVKDSINHLTNDLGKDPWADDFADDVIGDLERNYENYVPTDFDKYQEWCSAVASEVSRHVNRSEQASFLEELEDPEAYRKRLDICPECGATNAFDHETGICLNCGFNI